MKIKNYIYIGILSTLSLNILGMIDLELHKRPSRIQVYDWAKDIALENQQKHLLNLLSKLKENENTFKLAAINIQYRPSKMKKAKEPFCPYIKKAIYDLFQNNKEIQKEIRLSSITESNNAIVILTNFKNKYKHHINYISIINSYDTSTARANHSVIAINQKNVLNEKYSKENIQAIVAHELAHLILGHTIESIVINDLIQEKCQELIQHRHVQNKIESLPLDAISFLPLFEGKNSIFNSDGQIAPETIDLETKNKVLQELKDATTALYKSNEIAADIFSIFNTIELINQATIFHFYSPDILITYDNIGKYQPYLVQSLKCINDTKKKINVYDFSHNNPTHPDTSIRSDYFELILQAMLEELHPETNTLYQSGISALKQEKYEDAYITFTMITHLANDLIQPFYFPFYAKSLFHTTQITLLGHIQADKKNAIEQLNTLANQTFNTNIAAHANYHLAKAYLKGINNSLTPDKEKSMQLFEKATRQNENQNIKKRAQKKIQQLNRKTGKKRKRSILDKTDRDINEEKRIKKKRKLTIEQ